MRVRDVRGEGAAQGAPGGPEGESGAQPARPHLRRRARLQRGDNPGGGGHLGRPLVPRRQPHPHISGLGELHVLDDDPARVHPPQGGAAVPRVVVRPRRPALEAREALPRPVLVHVRVPGGIDTAVAGRVSPVRSPAGVRVDGRRGGEQGEDRRADCGAADRAVVRVEVADYRDSGALRRRHRFCGYHIRFSDEDEGFGEYKGSLCLVVFYWFIFCFVIAQVGRRFS